MIYHVDYYCQTLREVNSIEEMDEINDVSSYYYDGEWLHLKAVSEYDIHEQGKAKNFNIYELK